MNHYPRADMTKERATERVRVYPSTAKKLLLRKLNRIGGTRIAEVYADVLRKAEAYEKEHPESRKAI